jgi:glucose-6-phosphate 1-dehydrogenase
MIQKVVLFGATGDLAGRFLLPALGELLAAGELPGGIELTGVAVEDWTDDEFRAYARGRLEAHEDSIPVVAREALLRSLRYARVDFEDGAALSDLVHGKASTAQPVAAYLALPPRLFPVAIGALGAAALPPGSRIVVEKPFGENLDSARALNVLLARVAGAAGEQAIFRVDHVLGMHSVQNLVAVRQANRVPEAVWNGEHVERVDILWEETLALEGRAGFYDGAGALADVMQNHMMQILALVVMDPPDEAVGRALHDRKVEALRAVRPPAEREMASRTRRARYAAGPVYEDDGDMRGEVPAYADEEGVDPGRGTETFAEIMLDIDSPRWKGTRFRLRAGKALRRRNKGVCLTFRPVVGGLRPSAPGGNSLWIGLDGPNDVSLRLTGIAEGAPRKAVSLELRRERPPDELPAYGRVLLDVLRGGSSLSVRGDEAEEAWRIVDPVARAWSKGLVPLDEYPAGSEASWPPR